MRGISLSLKGEGKRKTMLINNQALFIHITKTGGITVGRLFNKKYKGNHTIPSKDKIKKYYTFTFVRHPIDRFISSFEYQKALTLKNINSQMKLRSRMKKLNFKFEDFVVSLSKKDIESNLHYRKQCAWIVNGIDYIARFENFENELIKILTKINQTKKIKEIKKHNASKRRDIQSYIKSDAVVKKLHQLYKDDFNRLNYPVLPI